ncbi:MAG TPA: erythromycin esterase [Cellvibrio sp.]|nr:erythromycin esterase [Cellvibrio sp.]
MLDTKKDIVSLVQKSAHKLEKSAEDYSSLVNLCANKPFILLGEATHGTQEFYQARCEITKQLILHHGLNLIAIEGDWPSAYRVNRYVHMQGTDTNANEALSDFKRFPLWMWRNTVVLEFVEWLRKYNENVPSAKQVGFYGLDMYSLYESVAAVLEYLDQVDPEAGLKAREYYSCLDHIGNRGHYGYAFESTHQSSCKNDVIRVLVNLRERSLVYVNERDAMSEDEQFQAEQNARLIQSAEGYYRQMLDSRVNTWNLRDSHMFETLDNLYHYVSNRLKSPAKIAVWEHNSHIGDARATYMRSIGQHNVGQLVRQDYGDDCKLIGFTTWSGTVTAASNWDGPAERKTVRKSLPNSIEDIFHRTHLDRFLLPMRGNIARAFQELYIERAIGVLYLPQSERTSHYFPCRLAIQFDAILHFDETTAIEPLDSTSEWIAGEADTFPFGV